MEDNYEDDVYDDVLEANHPQPTSNMSKGIGLQKPIPNDPGTRKSTKSGPPPSIPSKNKPQEEEEEEVSFETYEDNVYLQTDNIGEKTKERENKFRFRDSSFDSDIESPEVSPVAFKMPAPKPTVLPKPSAKPSLNKFQKPLASKPIAPAHQEETIGKLQLPSKPLINIKPFHPSGPKPMTKAQFPKPVSNLYRKGNQTGQSPPRASMPAFPGSLSGELGAALERRRLASVGVETVSRQENKMVSENDKPKFVSILQR
jgi:hypothetical protein